MRKPKKETGNQDPHMKPVESGEKKENTGQSIPGHPESKGGSRQGNVGHEYSSETGRGDRQV